MNFHTVHTEYYLVLFIHPIICIRQILLFFCLYNNLHSVVSQGFECSALSMKAVYTFQMFSYSFI